MLSLICHRVDSEHQKLLAKGNDRTYYVIPPDLGALIFLQLELAGCCHTESVYYKKGRVNRIKSIQGNKREFLQQQRIMNPFESCIKGDPM